MDSTVTLCGNLTRDPELRFTPSGSPLATFGVVFNKRHKTDDGKWEDGDPQFFDVVAWKSLAENVAESLQKGDRVIVVGRLEYQTWEKDGDKRSKVQLVADEVGPSLRWATATTEKASRRTVEQAAETVKAAFDGEEPF